VHIIACFALLHCKYFSRYISFSLVTVSVDMVSCMYCIHNSMVILMSCLVGCTCVPEKPVVCILLFSAGMQHSLLFNYNWPMQHLMTAVKTRNNYYCHYYYMQQLASSFSCWYSYVVLRILSLILWILCLWSTPPSRPNNVGLKCPSACPYVHPSIRKKFLWFQWNLVCR